VPVYEYACTECGEQLEVRQSFTDAALTVCPVCSGRLRKVLSPVGVVFKGSGFYRTDSRAAAAASNGRGSDAAGTDGAGTGGTPGQNAKGGDKGTKDGSGTTAGSGSAASGSDSGSGGGSGKESASSSKPAGPSKASSTTPAGAH
jgi:putative FmdB family regulatory protein